MGIDKSARSRTSTAISLHDDLVDFGNFLQSIKDGIAGNIANTTNIPARVTKLLAKKSDFDTLGLSAAQIKQIMEDEYKYANWDDEAANFAAVFSKAPALRTLVIDNIGVLSPTYNNDTLEYTAGAAQTALEGQLDSILDHYS